MNIDSIFNENGVLIAPAGAGKTETIVKLMKKDKTTKKVLILTHTNAGVETILRRIKKYNSISVQYVVCTIASFSARYVTKFPFISGYNGDDYDYENTYQGMIKLLDNPHIVDIIKNSYSRIYVDEYQDCTIAHHIIIKKLCYLLDYKIFADPLQCIYNFDSDCVDFNKIIPNDYKIICNMNYPWRWENGNKELGKWTIDVRNKLLTNQPISLNNLPVGVELFHYKDISEVVKKLYSLEKSIKSIVVLFNHKQEASYFARRMNGLYLNQEEIECSDLKEITAHIDAKDSNNVLKDFFNIVKSSYIKSSSEFSNIISKISNDNYNFDRIKTNQEIAKVCINFRENFDVNYINQLIGIIEKNKNIKVFRKELWEVFKKIIYQLTINKEKNAKKLLHIIRNRDSCSLKYRYKHLVSRILLVKGLEFDTVILMNPEELSKELFYVGISRPINKLIIATKNSDFNFVFKSK